MDSKRKIELITKLGTAVSIRGELKGVILVVLKKLHFLVSTGDEEGNWTEVVHLDDLEVWKDTK